MDANLDTEKQEENQKNFRYDIENISVSVWSLFSNLWIRCVSKFAYETEA